MHIQEIIKQAQAEATQRKINLVLTLDPYAEHEDDQFGYCPPSALSIFKHRKVLGDVSATGEVTLID